MVGRGPEAFDVDDSRTKNSGNLDYYYTHSDIEIGNSKKEQGREQREQKRVGLKSFKNASMLKYMLFQILVISGLLS